MTELIVQLRDFPALSAEDFHEVLCCLHFDLHRVVDKAFIAGALGFADQKLERLQMLIDIVQHFRDAIPGFHPYMAGLFFLRQFRECSLRPRRYSLDSVYSS